MDRRLSKCPAELQRCSFFLHIQDLQAVAEENAILMRECAMASLSALESMESSDDDSDGHGLTPHPEMLDSAPLSIPDTAAEFLSNARQTTLEKYEKQRAGEDGQAPGAPAVDDTPRPGEALVLLNVCAAPALDSRLWSLVSPVTAPSYVPCLLLDILRVPAHVAGLDDINEFESELEVGDKWKRRFRILQEGASGNAAEDSHVMKDHGARADGNCEAVEAHAEGTMECVSGPADAAAADIPESGDAVKGQDGKVDGQVDSAGGTNQADGVHDSTEEDILDSDSHGNAT
jgi:hypothetical protein